MFELVKKEKNNYHFLVKFSSEDWKKYVNESYENNKGKYAVQGFRKGKVPKKVIEQNYGESVFYDDAFSIGLQKEYMEILEKNTEIDPVTQPNVNIKKFDEDGVEIDFVIASVPEVKLGAYTGLKIETVKTKLDETKVDAELKQMQERGARYVVVDRKAQNGDFVTIDFVGRVDGKEFEGGKAEDYRLELGTHSFVDTFEDQVVGMTVGEKRVVKVTFPDNYTPELKNKPAEFDVTLNKVEEKQLPELNDEFASNVSEFETLTELKDDIKKHLQESLTNENNRGTENKVIEAVVKNAEVEVPEVMVQEQLNSYVKDFETKLSYQGLKLADYFAYTGSTVEDFKKEREAVAKENVKTRLVLEEIIKQEKLQASEKELDAKLQEIATKYKKSLEDYKKSMGEHELMYFENGIIMEKLTDFLKKNNELV